MTASDIDPFVPVFKHGGFFGDNANLYVLGGEDNSQPYLTDQGQFVPTNWTESSLSAGNVYQYDTTSKAWSQQATLQPVTGSGVQGTFSQGAYGWNTKLSTAYVYGGSSIAGSSQLNPGAPYIYAGPTDAAKVAFTTLTSFDTKSFRWRNDTVPMQWTEGGQLVSLPGLETKAGGVMVAMGGILRPQESVSSYCCHLV
jgi:hypothetical protein